MLQTPKIPKMCVLSKFLSTEAEANGVTHLNYEISCFVEYVKRVKTSIVFVWEVNLGDEGEVS